ncbi:response regulator transcription factor [Actinophytocola algeriensis]|uniref:response regulator transcription factor n=1 Tax=Actinophytocola algeriensis TaxID=1768010 RepID=UPI00160E2E44|nr:response regulator transcription factor [Actinophytocola algeriensis]
MARRSSGDSEAQDEGRSIRVLLAEDMDLLRTALVSLLSVEEDIEVIADLKCNERAVSVAVRLRPDVAVVSADLPENKGLTTVHELRKRLPECQIVALTVKRPVGLLKRLLAADVSGLIDKNAPAARLLHAIRGVAQGGTVIDANLVIAALSAGRNPFTPRELSVLQLAAEGASGPEIAKQLSLSPGTVRNYLSNAMNKTGARTRIDAIRIATESGWL